MKYLHLFSFISILFLFSCSTSKSSLSSSNVDKDKLRVSFYNTENLYDTLNDPLINDEEFLPTSESKWTSERYQKKITDLSTVIKGLGFPDAMGFSEVENKSVLNDLVNSKLLKPYNYKIVHYDSPDLRGIDVGFIYKQDKMKVIDSEKLGISFPKEIDPKGEIKTRDILHVTADVQGEKFHFYVNHWPSRRDGQIESEPKRIFVAQVLKKSILEVESKDKNAKIVIIGDFNDEPGDRSISSMLGAKPNVMENFSNTSDHLINMSFELKKAGKGTHYYKDWNMLDQVIVSSTFYDMHSTWNVVNNTANIFSERWIMYDDPKKGLVPNKTYSGIKYYGGYSDHLPIYIDFAKTTMKK